MFNRIQLLAYFLTISSLILTSCSKDQNVTPDALRTLQNNEHLQHLNFRSNCDPITIPAGSTNALAQAISSICEEGIIYLEAGEHTQNTPLTIEKSIKLIGQDGAVLKLAAGTPQPLVADDTGVTNGSIAITSGIRFLNAPNSLIQNLTIEAMEGDGSNALLMEHSNGSAVMNNKINNFQFGVLVEYSNRITIMRNEIVTSSVWLTDFSFTDAHAITIINGKSAYIAENETSQSVFGIWGCDEWGTIENNNSHDNYIGIILCNVPNHYFNINGELTGSNKPGTGYKVRNNRVANSFAESYLVIDGANTNLIENNVSINAGTYDLELTTETFRFGSPPAPEAYNNTVIVGDQEGFVVKDCGTNNRVVGAVMVNTSVDECE